MFCRLWLDFSLNSTATSCVDHLPLDVAMFNIYVKPALHIQNMNIFPHVWCDVDHHNTSELIIHQVFSCVMVCCVSYF